MIMLNSWNSIPDSYDQLNEFAFAVLYLFDSTFLSKQYFSSMNFIKSKLSCFIDENLESCLKLKTTPTYLAYTFQGDARKLFALSVGQFLSNFLLINNLHYDR